MRRANDGAEDDLSGEQPRAPRWVVAALVAAIAGLVVAGGLLLDDREAHLRVGAEAQLHAVARLKADQVATWRGTLRSLGEGLRARAYLTGVAARLLEQPDLALADEVDGRLRGLVGHFDVFDVAVADENGGVRLSLQSGDDRLHQAAADALARALLTGQPELSELHDPAGDSPPHVDVVVPLPSPGGVGFSGALLLLVDARPTLFPMVSSWPASSDSAEGLLVRRDGDAVRVLSPRRSGDTGLAAPAAFSSLGLPGLIDGDGIAYGVDDRGAEVIAAQAPVPGAEWLVVAKQDASEALATWRREAVLIVALIVLLVAFVVVAGVVLWRRRRERHLTALLAAVRARRTSEERHRATLMSVVDAVIATDRRGAVELLNGPALQLLGMRESDARGRPLAEILAPRDARTGQPVDLSDLGRVGRTDEWHVPAEGGPVEVEATASAIRTALGELTGSVLVLRDRTTERAAERALLEGERTLLESQRAAAIGHYRMNLRTGEWTGSPVLYSLFGMDGWTHARDGQPYDGQPAGDGRGRPFRVPRKLEDWAPLLHPDGRFELVEHFRTHVVEDGRPIDREFAIIRATDGATRWLHGLGTVERDGGGRPAWLYGTAQDVTERRAAAERIAHLNRVLRAVGDVTRLSMRARDAEQLIRDTCRLLVDERGYGEAIIVLVDGQLRPTAVAQAGAVDQAELAAIMETGALPPCLLRAAAADDVVVLQDRSAQCSTCTMFSHRHYPSDSMLARLWSGGATRGVLHVTLAAGTESDLDERALLGALADDLAYALENLALREAKEKVEAERDAARQQLASTLKLEAIGRLAGGIAHDFNNLLSVILSYTSMAIEALEADDPLREDLAEIQAAGERGALLTRQLLAFSRKQILKPAVLGLDGVVDGMAQLLRRLLGEDIELVVVHQPGLWKTRVDPGQIEQSIMNLAVNARDAMPRGGKLVIETSNATLDDEYARHHVSVVPGEYVRLAVSDNGCGMDEEVAARVFEPFFTTKDVGKGTGLGLSTVYGIVKQSGGNIWVYSEVGRGTVLKIYLPRTRTGGTEPAMPAVVQPKLVGTETVLVVEDEEAVRNIALRVLRQAGYDVLEASSGGDALVVAERHEGPIHLLLADVVMPRLSGPEVAARIVAARPDTRVLYMSGYTDTAIVEHGALAPGTHFIGKPFNVNDLLAKVRHVLDGGAPSA